MIKENFFVITGGPGGGKTSLLTFLASKGYDYVPEAAREIIRERLSRGLSPRPAPAAFAQQMFTKDFDNYITNSNRTSLLFFDRSFLDSASLLYDSDLSGYEKIKNSHLINRYNQKVFITPPWEQIYCTDSERDQTFQQSIEVYNKIYSWYAEHQYNLVVIPKATLENRAAFI
ncbi:MAG TPA: AAA family ATPase, partial [Chitinophagaceae bacterium]|nr:AAA family ATPase [Chitinophagaceae bacterium]